MLGCRDMSLTSRIIMNTVFCKQVLLWRPQLDKSSSGTQKGALVRSHMSRVHYTQKATIKIEKSFIKHKLFILKYPITTVSGGTSNTASLSAGTPPQHTVMSTTLTYLRFSRLATLNVGGSSTSVSLVSTSS